jgi:hypothetical protein
VPRLAPGVELLGRFEDSGFKEPPYLARRADGQVVQMAPLLHALAEEIDGERTFAEIGDALSHRIRRGVTADMVEMLVSEQLRPLGVVEPADGSRPVLKKIDPLLALKFRTKVVPERWVSGLTRLFTPLFFPPVVLAVIAGLVAITSAATPPPAATAVPGPECWEWASTSSGPPSTRTSRTPTDWTSAAGCGPTSAGCTSTRCSPSRLRPDTPQRALSHCSCSWRSRT